MEARPRQRVANGDTREYVNNRSSTWTTLFKIFNCTHHISHHMEGILQTCGKSRFHTTLLQNYLFHKQEDALLQAFKPSVCTSNKLRQAAYIQHVHVNEITNASDECMINNPLCHEHLIRHMAHFCVTHATTYVLKILPHRAIQVSERCMCKT